MKKLSKKRCLLDTNILVAFLNRKHRYHSQTRKIFEKLANKEFEGVISSQNLLELAAVLVHGFRLPKKEVAKDLCLFASDPIFEIIYPNREVLERFFKLMKKENRLHIVDLFLLATALEHRIEVLVTADTGFLKSKEIEVYNPFV
ncbi:MAG: type II toxin-antitoxin system VapC family toxin [Microgenomates group bacterium]